MIEEIMEDTTKLATDGVFGPMRCPKNDLVKINLDAIYLIRLD